MDAAKAEDEDLRADCNDKEDGYSFFFFFQKQKWGERGSNR